jgi:uncharacterized protein (DUF1501 family)
MPTAKFTDEKFLIVCNKGGGEDCYSKVIPLDTARYSVLQQYRPTSTPALTEIANNNTTFAPDAAGNQMSLHPVLAPLMPAWSNGEMAVTLTCGSLYQPMTDDEATVWYYYSNSPAEQKYPGMSLPLGIRAHDTGQNVVSSQRALGPFYTGWIGNLTDAFQGYTNNSPFPSCVSWSLGYGGMTLMPVGQQTSPASLTPMSVTFNRTYEYSNNYGNYLNYLDVINSYTYTTPRQAQWAKAWNVAKAATAFFNNVNTGSGFQVDQYFNLTNATNPWANPWQANFLGIARSIETRSSASGPLSNRTVFYIGNGAYDMHGSLDASWRSANSDWATAIACFRTAMIALGLWNECLVLELTEFGRNMVESGATPPGTDHGWGWHQIMIGGAVAGKGKTALGQSTPSTGVFGALPVKYGAAGYMVDNTLQHQLDNGALIPQISWEQVLAEPLRWFGCDPTDLNAILPNRATFGNPIYSMTS